MFQLIQCLTPKAVSAALIAPNKRSLFQQLSSIAAKAHGVDQHLVFDRLMERERLGSTGFGSGIAIPHGKIEGLTGVIGVCVSLKQAVDFEAIDDLPIDLVFMLLSPVDGGADHLKALASVSRVMRDKRFVAKLRGAASNDALFALFSTQEVMNAA